MTGTSKGWIITKKQYMCYDCKGEIERRTLCWIYKHDHEVRRRCKKCQTEIERDSN